MQRNFLIHFIFHLFKLWGERGGISVLEKLQSVVCLCHAGFGLRCFLIWYNFDNPADFGHLTCSLLLNQSFITIEVLLILYQKQPSKDGLRTVNDQECWKPHWNEMKGST